MKTFLPSRLKGAPSELAASAEALLGVTFPFFLPSSSLPASPSPKGQEPARGRREAECPPKAARQHTPVRQHPEG